MDNIPVRREEAKDLNISNYRLKQTIKLQLEKNTFRFKAIFFYKMEETCIKCKDIGLLKWKLLKKYNTCKVHKPLAYSLISFYKVNTLE